MSNINSQPENPTPEVNNVPETQESTTFDSNRVLPYLERLGITAEDLSNEEFNESMIASRVLSNERFTEDYNKQIKTSHDSFLTDKLKKIVSELTGLDVEDVKEDTDFKKIISKGVEKINTNSNTDIDTLSLQYREKELQLQQQLESLQSQLEEAKSSSAAEIREFKINSKVNSFINSQNLTSTAEANKSDIVDMALTKIRKDYDIKEKDGLLVLYKGSQPIYKDNSSQLTLLEDEVNNYLNKLGFIKQQEEVKTLSVTDNTKTIKKTSASGYSRRNHFKR